MDKYFYSAKRNTFFPDVLKEDFEKVDSWPEDAVEISDDIYTEFGRLSAPEGKIMAAGADGLPVWVDMEQPVMTREQMIVKAELLKERLLTSAANSIAPLQDAVDLDIATEAEIVALALWKKYRVMVNRVNPENAPDISWPEEPDDVA